MVEEIGAIENTEEKEKDPLSWYIVHCYSGQEYKVKARLEQLIETHSLEAKFQNILIPEEETIEIKNNKRVEKLAKKFPGYLFVYAIMDEELCYLIRHVSGVSKFVGAKNRPTPIREEEIAKVLRVLGDKTKKIEVDFELGEVIKIIAGPFRGYSGNISEISPEKGKLKSLISIFGRETPVELEFKQVEKAVK